MHRNLFALAALLVMQFAAPEVGAVCTAGNPNASLIESTPTSAFTNHGNGTLTHSLTGLMWKQCAEGKSGAGCATGIAAAMDWQAALAAAAADTTAGYGDWRLPNLKELGSIVELCGYGPAINQGLFPATASVSFWSGSSFAQAPDYAWRVDFYHGLANAFDGMAGGHKNNDFHVRLVRAGGSFDSFDAQWPPACNADIDGNGSIDALTDGLLFMRALFGLTGTAVTSSALGVGATRNDWGMIRAFMNERCGTSFGS